MQKSKSNHQQYDKIFKLISEFMVPFILKRSFGIDSKKVKITYRELNPEFNTKLKRRHADSLFLIYIDGEPAFILHIEFQMANSNDMIYRMYDYHILIAEKYKNYKIHHAVVYAGRAVARMRTSLKENEIFTGFELLDLGRLDFESLLNSDDPIEVMLSLLTDFGTRSDEAVLKTIISRLEALLDDEDLFERLSQLEILSISRNLDTLLTELITDMYKVNFNAEVKDHHLYRIRQKIRQEGREEGWQEGRQEGETIGYNKATKANALAFYKNGVPLPIIAKSLNISLHDAQAIVKQ